ncbi:hypothetical protein QQ045_030349 [Rhodiola kirilowii]
MEGETVELPSDAIERVVQLFRESMATKAFVTILEVLKEETITAMQCANDASIQLCKDPSNIVEEADDTSTSTENMPLMTDFICNMVKKEYTMQVNSIFSLASKEASQAVITASCCLACAQETIVTSLSFKTQSEELESYCRLMWSLRPNFDDDVMAEAWELF